MNKTVGSRRPRLLAIGHFVQGLGLTRVMGEILSPLAADFDIDLLGIAYKGPTFRADTGVIVHPTNPRGGDVFGAHQAKAMIEAQPPDIVLMLHDIWIFENYAQAFAPVRGKTSFVGYMPLDGAITHEGLARAVRGLDHAVVYTRWAARQLEDALDRLQAQDPQAARPTIGVIGHGVDAAVFSPPAELVAADFDPRARAPAKRRVFPGLEDPEHGFVVLNANRPAVRKRIDHTIEAFAVFAKDKPANVKLCLHQAITDESTTVLLQLAEARGVADRLIYNPLSARGAVLADADLALLFGAGDVGVNTSMGEGWGLLSFEHAAAGAAQIVPRSSACAELWNDETAMLVDTGWRGVPPFSPLQLAEVDVRSAAAAMQALYADRGRLQRLSRAAQAYASGPKFGWAGIADQWRQLFGAVLAARDGAVSRARTAPPP
jgi:glycosyltransferase involved in cell wall biosynthesis